MSDNESSREDRQLPATERRLQQARDEGQLARSRDLVHLAALFTLLGVAAGMGPWLTEQALDMVAQGLRFDREAAFDMARLTPRLAGFTLAGLTALVPVAAALAFALALGTVAVGGWNLSTQALSPKFERVSPAAGLARLFDWHQWLDHARLALLAAALLAVAASYLMRHAPDLPVLARMPVGAALGQGFAWVVAGMGGLVAVCALAAVLDAPLQLYKHHAQLRMTFEEVRQENKESEGDPHMKGERRRRQREMSRGRMLAAVPKASVVITNPTHYAVALQYDEATMRAPRIVAMGADHLALKIREVAASCKVPVLEAPPLARALYRHGDVGAEVPVQMYTAVAQVLAWVMRLRDARRPPPLPVIEVPPGLDPLEAGA